MRYAILILVFAVLAFGTACADDTRTSIGDTPRTYSHYLNSQQAALCGASAATGGASACFYNPAAASRHEGISGQATLRFNVKSRDYFPDGDERYESSDDGFLFSHAVAVKSNESLTLGFGYACPSYRRLELTGMRPVVEDTLTVYKQYKGTFTGSLRFFEAVIASRIGDSEQGALGVSAGVVSLGESVRDECVGDVLEKARVRGMGFTAAAGFLFNATESLTFGLGYRWGSEIKVQSDDWYGEDRRDETSKTQATAVAGMTYGPSDLFSFHASYVRNGWDKVNSTLSAYKENDGARNEYDVPLSTAAFGVESTILDGKLTLRAGYSVAVGDDIEHGIVPESSVGFGGAWNFEEYVVEAAFVREQFSEGGETAQVTNYGFYTSVGYVF
jgi:opacity protein-like surface antigen